MGSLSQEHRQGFQLLTKTTSSSGSSDDDERNRDRIDDSRNRNSDEKRHLTAAGDELESGPSGPSCTESRTCPCVECLSDNAAQPGQSTFFQATVNAFVLLIGLGTLSSAYAVEKCGFFGLLVLCITATFFWIGSKLVCLCMEPDKSLMNYQDVAAKAFPRWGRLLITTFFYVDILGSLVGYMVSMGDTMLLIFPHSHLNVLGFTGKTIFTSIAFLVILPTVWFRKLSTISYLSFWCAISILVTIVCLLVAGIKDHIGFDQKVAIFRLENFPIATGVYTFTFGATAVLPNVYRSMKSPERFSEHLVVCLISSLEQVLTLSFAMATLLNLIVGIIGAVMFGSRTQPQVHLSMPPSLLASKVAIWATLITPVTQFALFLSPISCELETALLARLPWRSDSRLSYAASMLLRTGLLLGIALGALLFPYFANIIELIGSSVSVTLCVIFPCVFYLQIFYQRLIQRQHRPTLAAIVAIAGVSAIAGIAGTVVSIQDLVRKKN